MRRSSASPDGDYVYFAHSFACDDGAAAIATAEYGRDLAAVVRRGNVLGAQFHPERSRRGRRPIPRKLSRMIIYPAMDLMGGRCVRLAQGRFDDANDLCRRARRRRWPRFAAAGAEWAHVVDLDGARAKRAAQHELIAALARRAPLKLQVGGGFRTREQVARMLDGWRGAGGDRQPRSRATRSVSRAWIDEFGAERI